MKVLSLLQPWASLVVTPNPNGFLIGPDGGKLLGIKAWETRSWRPRDPKLISLLQTEGFLIHASLGWKKEQSDLMNTWPFEDYKHLLPAPLPLGAIIGHVKLVGIWTTEKWVSKFSASETERSQEEFRFGNYDAGRFAWQLVSPTSFNVPIPTRGSLNFWDYEITIPGLIK